MKNFIIIISNFHKTYNIKTVGHFKEKLSEKPLRCTFYWKSESPASRQTNIPKLKQTHTLT